MNQFKTPEAAHKKFNHTVKSSLLEMYREGIQLKKKNKSKEEIEGFIQEKLGNIMISSFNQFMKDLEINESGFKFEFKNGVFQIDMPDDFRGNTLKILHNKKGYNEAKINEFFDFLDEYPAKLTTQFSDEAKTLAIFIYEEKPIEIQSTYSDVPHQVTCESTDITFHIHPTDIEKYILSIY